MQPTLLGFSRGTRVAFFIGIPLLGAGLGFFVPRLADLVLKLPWVPFKGPIKIVAALPDALTLVTALLLGAAGGMWFAHLIIKESLAVTVTDGEMRLHKDGAVRRFRRHDIGAVFLDGKQLVLLGKSDEDLAREPHESTPVVAQGRADQDRVGPSPDRTDRRGRRRADRARGGRRRLHLHRTAPSARASRANRAAAAQGQPVAGAPRPRQPAPVARTGPPPGGRRADRHPGPATHRHARPGGHRDPLRPHHDQ